VTTVEMAHLNPKDDELMPTFLDLVRYSFVEFSL
jgi:hypothetical protein